MKVRVVGDRVAQELFEAEAAVDVAIQRMAALAGRLPAARQEANISAVVGQGAFNRSSRAFSALVLAREELVAVHGELDEVRCRVGLRNIAFGSQDKPPPAIEATGGLHLVGERAAG